MVRSQDRLFSVRNSPALGEPPRPHRRLRCHLLLGAYGSAHRSGHGLRAPVGARSPGAAGSSGELATTSPVLGGSRVETPAGLRPGQPGDNVAAACPGHCRDAFHPVLRAHARAPQHAPVRGAPALPGRRAALLLSAAAREPRTPPTVTGASDGFAVLDDGARDHDRLLHLCLPLPDVPLLRTGTSTLRPRTSRRPA